MKLFVKRRAQYQNVIREVGDIFELLDGEAKALIAGAQDVYREARESDVKSFDGPVADKMMRKAETK